MCVANAGCTGVLSSCLCVAKLNNCPYFKLTYAKFHPCADPGGVHRVPGDPGGVHPVPGDPGGVHPVPGDPGGVHQVPGDPGGVHQVPGHPLLLWSDFIKS